MQTQKANASPAEREEEDLSDGASQSGEATSVHDAEESGKESLRMAADLDRGLTDAAGDDSDTKILHESGDDDVWVGLAETEASTSEEARSDAAVASSIGGAVGHSREGSAMDDIGDDAGVDDSTLITAPRRTPTQLEAVVCSDNEVLGVPLSGKQKKKKKRRRSTRMEKSGIGAAAEGSAASTEGTSLSCLPRIPLDQTYLSTLRLAVTSKAAHLAIRLNTPDVLDLMVRILVLKSDVTRPERERAEELRLLGSRSSLETLTCSYLTLQAAAESDPTHNTERSSDGAGASVKDQSNTAPECRHPWSPELSGPNALAILDGYLTDQERRVLRYLEINRGKTMPEGLFDKFVERLSWAGKSHEAIKRKDILLRSST
jgi:hypothetical protein